MDENEKRRSLSDFERFIFGITRWFAICGAAVVMIGIVVLTIGLLMQHQNTSVSYEDVSKKIAIKKAEAPTGVEKQPDSESTPLTKIPDDIKAIFSGDNERVLKGWLSTLSESDQRDFLDNMVKIIKEAKTNNAELSSVINEYKIIKLKKLHQSDFDKYAAIGVKAAYIGGIFSLLLTVSILSLVLVMLAIERNTRPISSYEVKEYPQEGLHPESPKPSSPSE